METVKRAIGYVLDLFFGGGVVSVIGVADTVE
ncbi:MAG: hypothetical protein HW403_2 [Dehalococcoidia bacterium]|nr:hypothetical protein [Dehalococcoidia bacterium]